VTLRQAPVVQFRLLDTEFVAIHRYQSATFSVGATTFIRKRAIQSQRAAVEEDLAGAWRAGGDENFAAASGGWNPYRFAAVHPYWNSTVMQTICPPGVAAWGALMAEASGNRDDHLGGRRGWLSFGGSLRSRLATYQAGRQHST
jgi:hypothetical protein